MESFRLPPISFAVLLIIGCLLALTGCQGLAPANTTGSTIALSTSSLNFGSVMVGSSKTMQETLSNPSAAAVTVSQATASGAGFSISGLKLPLTLSPSQTVSFSATYSPTTPGSSSGSLTVVSNASNSSVGASLSGTAVTSGSLAANPSNVAFGNVQVGSTASQFESLTNTGGSTVTISQVNVTGAGFSINNLTLPVTLNANQSVTFTTVFSPANSGSASGSLTIVSDSSDSNLTISLSGTGTAAGQLSISPASLSFGTVAVGSSSSLGASVTATSSAVTISSASSGSGEFSLSGITFPLTIPTGQSATFTVTFTPNVAGAANANLSFSSDALNSPTAESLSGTGQAQSHSVGLSWDAASDAVTYNVYRKLSSDSNYTQINSGNVSTSYTDSNVASGSTYDYAVTAVDGNSQESAYSNIARAVIPSN